jgi:GAF domain-containing protein
MSISGSLEDVAVSDVLQFISLGKRTGTLELERDGERARLGFHEGTLVTAQAPGAPRLGDLLLESKRVDADTLQQAVSEQATSTVRRSLGQILVEGGQVAPEVVQRVIKLQLERAVEQVLIWERGSFDFALDEIRPVDDIGMAPGTLVPNMGLAANVVLLEAARIFDERDRRRPAEAAEAAIDGLIDEDFGTDPGIVAGPEVRALSPDREFVRRLRLAIAPHARVRRVALGRASGAPLPGESDVVLVDARAGALDPEGLMLLRAARPEARFVVLVDSPEAVQIAYRNGAAAAVPPEVETVRACLVNLLEVTAAHPTEAPAAPESGVRRLQRVFGDLRSGVASATVALNLMQLVSESFERAALLLVKKDRLAALGAFGTAADGRPLAAALRRLEVAPSGLLLAALGTSRVQSSSFVQADLPGALASLLGAPALDRVVVIPVAGTERVIAVVYADNAEVERPPRDIDLLEVAAAQVGIAFENELLRRQLSRGPF